MLKRIFLVFLVSPIVISEDYSFNNVTIVLANKNKTEIKVLQSKSLKENLPDNENLSVQIIGSIPVLYEKSVSDLDKLETLNLRNVGLHEIKPGSFWNLPGLKALLLQENPIKILQSGSFTGLKLNILNLANCGLNELQNEAFSDMTINNLVVNSNNLSAVSGDVFKNSSISVLQMYGNQLKKITFMGIFNLRSLYLSSNKIEEIDGVDLPDLESLDLSHNEINVLRAGDLKNLPKLTNLEIVGNKLEEIPEGVFNGTNLVYLKLNYNNIRKIGIGAFHDMAEISVLHLDHNNLTVFENKWLENCPKLAYLILGYNNFTELPDEAFKNYPTMFSINFENNLISSVSPKVFEKFKSVVNFGLGNNLLAKWDIQIPDGISIGTIDLSFNNMTCLEDNLDELFKNYDFVHLDGNPWTEDCKKSIDEFQKRKVTQRHRQN